MFFHKKALQSVVSVKWRRFSSYFNVLMALYCRVVVRTLKIKSCHDAKFLVTGGVTKTPGATSDGKVGIMTNLEFQLWRDGTMDHQDDRARSYISNPNLRQRFSYVGFSLVTPDPYAT